MSGLGAWIWGGSQLDDAVDKATSELLPAGASDMALNLEICDQIRSKSVPAKDAMRALKRRLNHKNPNVQLLALTLTDICIKNGGDLFLTEIASREFMDNLVSILKIPGLNHDLKEILLRHIQNWSIALEGRPSLSYIGQVYKTLVKEGYKFPPKDLASINSAMVDTMIAPEWIDSDLCLRCRTPFSFTNRKHHCRNCGQVFDQACSSKNMALPHFGITQEVRVCDTCYNKLTKKAEKADKGHRHSTSLHGQRHKSARELADAELQRAIQLSLEEVNGTSGRSRAGYVPSQPSPTKWGYSEPPIVDRSTYPTRKDPIADDDDDPDLKAAIEASLREANAPKPSAPVVVETPRSEQASYGYSGPAYSQSYPPSTPQTVLPKIPSYDLEPLEADAILTFNQTVDQVQAQGGRDLSRYPAVTELYEKANGLRPKLALTLDDTGRKEQMLSEMHDQLSQAVKLYDQILSQQVAQPRWRAPAATPYQQYQSPPQQDGLAYAPNGYNQWTPQQQQQPYQATPEPRREPTSPQMSYAPPPVQGYQIASRPETSQPQWSQQTPQQPSYQPQYAQTTPSAPPPQMSISPAPSLNSQQYPQQQQYQPYAAVAPPPQQLPFVQPPPPPTPSSSIHSLPATIPQSPPPPVQSYQPPTPQAPATQPYFANNTSLNRHHSVAYAPAAPSGAPSPPSHLTRSNTVAGPAQYQRQPAQPFQAQVQSPPSQQQVPYQVSSPPPAPAPAPVVALPQFPSVPTTAPQSSFSVYGSSIPSEFEHKEERKEALLIDL